MKTVAAVFYGIEGLVFGVQWNQQDRGPEPHDELTQLVLGEKHHTWPLGSITTDGTATVGLG